MFLYLEITLYLVLPLAALSLAVAVALIMRLSARNKLSRATIQQLQGEQSELAKQMVHRMDVVEHQTRELSVIDRLLNTTSRAADADALVVQILTYGKQLLPQTDAAACWTPQGGTCVAPHVLVLKAVEGCAPADLAVDFRPLPAPGERIDDEMFLGNNIAAGAFFKQKPVAALLTLVVTVERKPVFVLTFAALSAEQPFTAEDRERLRRFRDHVGPVFQRFDLLRLLERRNAELERLDGVVRALNLEIEYERVLDTLVQQALALAPQTRKGVLLSFDAKAGVFRSAASIGYTDAETAALELSYDAATQRYAHDRAQAEQGVYVLQPDAGAKSLLVMTFDVQERMDGLLVLEQDDAAPAYAQTDVDKLRRFRDHAVSAYHKARYIRTVEQKNRELEIAHKQLQKINMDLTFSVEVIKLKNHLIGDSIRYARRIQESLNPRLSRVHRHLPETFAFYRPMEIVSGDFYWFSAKNDVLMMAVVDCTGHGVPGAFMAVLGSNLFNHLVNDEGLTDPAEVLNRMDGEARAILSQHVEDEELFDGMEVGLLALDLRTGQLSYAGAGRPLYVVNKDGRLTRYGGDRTVVGGGTFRRQLKFTRQDLTLHAGDDVYLTTDGYANQFGGRFNKKYTSRRLTETLEQMHTYSMPDQARILESVFDEWVGERPQTDDVLMLGFRYAPKEIW